MKYIGFIKEMDMNIPNAKPFLEFRFNSSPSNCEIERSKIIDYLDRGIFFGGSMGGWNDDEGQFIGYADYFTDGFYVWPRYFPYYLKKYDSIPVDAEFIDHIIKRDFYIPSISENELNQIDKDFTEVWSKKKSKGEM